MRYSEQVLRKVEILMDVKRFGDVWTIIQSDADLTGNSNALSLAAICEGLSGRWETARDLVDQALAAGPDDPLAHTMHALLLFEHDRRSGAPASGAALEAVDRALTLRPDEGFLHGLKAQLLLRGPTPNLMECLQHAERGLGLDPEDLESALAHVAALNALKRLDEAARALDQLLSLYPEEPRVHVLRHYYYLARRDRATARRALDEALRMDPTSTHAHEAGDRLSCRRWVRLPLLGLFVFAFAGIGLIASAMVLELWIWFWYGLASLALAILTLKGGLLAVRCYWKRLSRRRALLRS